MKTTDDLLRMDAIVSALSLALERAGAATVETDQLRYEAAGIVFAAIEREERAA